jgi:L-lactate dehydrogenase complex protein LldG
MAAGKMVNNEAREEILRSIRSHLAASPPQTATPQSYSFRSVSKQTVGSHVETFKQNLEAVAGHCILVQNEAELTDTLNRLTAGKRTATSNAPPPTKDLFNFDVGITNAQAAIAETGTLVLDSAAEQNRLVSLVPPVHIAILDASRIFATLGETLAALQSGDELGPAITFITGPSRTADIELTLTIGVHGPQELYVIINVEK